MMIVLLVVKLCSFMGICNIIHCFQSARFTKTSSLPKISMSIQNFDALLFDCDGVIAETERDCHRVTFNQAFKQKGLSTEWDVEMYGELLKIGGGKERMTFHFDQVGWPSVIPQDQRVEFIKNLHKLKTELFQSAVESGIVPARPGVTRLMDDAFKMGIKVAICSTSNEAAVTTIARTLLGEERLSKIKIFAGDVVAKKKPAPDVYLLAASTLEVSPERCWVVEDSEIGLKAAKAAGMRCVVTKSVYTQQEDFASADVTIHDLDKGLDGPITTLYLDYKASPTAFKPLKATDNSDLFSANDRSVAIFSKIAKGEMGKGGFPF